MSLPEGFVLDAPEISPPEGFVLDSPGINNLPEQLTPEMEDMAYEKYKQSVVTVPSKRVMGFSKTDFINQPDMARKWAALVPKTRNHFEKLTESWKRGKENFLLDQSYFDAVILNQGDPDEIYRLHKLSSARQQLDPIEGRNLLEDMEYGTANIIPGMMEGAKQSLPEMAVGVVAGIPGGPVGVVAGLGAGFKVGGTYAWYKQGAGEMLLSMKDKGLSNRYAKITAAVAGVPYALIENLQVGQITPGLREGVNRIVNKSLTDFLVKVVKQYGKTVTQETLEEVAQEAVAIVAEDTASYLSGQGIAINKEWAKERAQRLWETTKGAAVSMALLPMPGAVFDLAQVHSIRAIETPKVADDITVTEEIKNTINESTELSPDEKDAGLKYVGDIETNIVKNVVDKFPEPVTDQVSAQKMVQDIARYLGLENPEKFTVEWYENRKNVPRSNSFAAINAPDKIVKIALQHKEWTQDIAGFYTKRGTWIDVPNKTPGRFNQDLFKKVVIHEIGHVAKPAVISKGRRYSHHKEFVEWVNENVKRLTEIQEAVEPVYRPETVGPIVGPAEINKIIVETHNKTGGSTIDRTGKPVEKGFAVAISKGFEKILSTDKITEQDINVYKQEHADYLTKNPDAIVGTWVENGKTYLDISKVVSTEKEALKIGRKNNQLAIFDLEKKESIPIEQKVGISGGVSTEGKPVVPEVKPLAKQPYEMMREIIPELVGKEFPYVDPEGNHIKVKVLEDWVQPEQYTRGLVVQQPNRETFTIEAEDLIGSNWREQYEARIRGLGIGLRQAKKDGYSDLVQQYETELENVKSKIIDVVPQKVLAEYPELGKEPTGIPKEEKRAPVSLIDRLFKKWPNSEIKDVTQSLASYVTPDGRILDVTGRTHYQLAESIRTTTKKLYLESGIMRLRDQTPYSGIIVEFSKFPTDEQIRIANKFVGQYSTVKNTIVGVYRPLGYTHILKEEVDIPSRVLDSALKKLWEEEPSAIEGARKRMGLEEMRPKPEGKPKEPKGLRRRQTLAIGHEIPKILGWSEEQRRKFNKEITGKESMKDMTLEESRKLSAALLDEAKKTGVEYKTPVASELKATIEDLITTISTVGKRKITEQVGPQFLYQNRIRKAIKVIDKGQSGLQDALNKPEKIIEDFDGAEPRQPGKKHIGGPFYKTFIEPVFRQADIATNNTTDSRQEFCDFVSSKVENTDDWMFTPKEVKGLKFKLTDADRVGIAFASQDKGAYKRLIMGNLFTPEQIEIIRRSLTDTDKAVGKFYTDWFKSHETILFSTAQIAGYDMGKIKRVANYFGIVSKDTDAETQPDFVDDLSGILFGAAVGKPGAEVITPRTGATGPLETNIAKVFFIKSARVNRFIQMAPTAAKLAKIIGNKNLRRAINNRTYGRGTVLLDKFLRDSINGASSTDMDNVDTVVEYLRRAGAAYAISDNILSVLRQEFLGAFNSLSNTPKLFPYFIRNQILYPPFARIKALKEFVFSRSIQMQARENLPLTRIRAAKKAIAANLKGQSNIKRGFKLINMADEDAALRVWKSVYDMNFDISKDETQAIEAADYDSRTRQSNPSPQNLPAIFRGGQVSKIITTFNTEMAPLFNIYKNEIIRAKARGEIGYGMAGYRILMSHVVPAVLMGIISRGRLPKNWKEIGMDMLFYAVSPLLFLSNPVQQMITGVRTGIIPMAGIDSAVYLTGNLRRMMKWGELTPKERSILLRSTLRNATKTVGGFTGLISAQHIRSIEGLFDLITKKSDDWRRLVWSEKALEEPKGKSQMRSWRKRL